MRETTRERAERHRQQEQMMATKNDERERAEKMKSAHYMIFPKGHRIFVYPAHTEGKWKPIDVFFSDHAWRYRCTGRRVGSTVSDRIEEEIQRRQFEIVMKNEPNPPRPCPSCGQETNKS